MFTGIVTDIGRVRSLNRSGDTHIVIATSYDVSAIDTGASIACSGPCLTVVDKGDDWFAVDVSAETVSRTTIGAWRADSRLNLERSLRVGDELGGHIVAGHVDGTAEIISRYPEGESLRFVFEVAPELKGYVAAKGSIALDGISLTVNDVDDARFGVNIIPHTQRETTFPLLEPGDRVNVEVDVIARYVARLRGSLVDELH
jgi:riboflavin synthase